LRDGYCENNNTFRHLHSLADDSLGIVSNSNCHQIIALGAHMTNKEHLQRFRELAAKATSGDYFVVKNKHYLGVSFKDRVAADSNGIPQNVRLCQVSTAYCGDADAELIAEVKNILALAESYAKQVEKLIFDRDHAERQLAKIAAENMRLRNALSLIATMLVAHEIPGASKTAFEYAQETARVALSHKDVAPEVVDCDCPVFGYSDGTPYTVHRSCCALSETATGKEG